jgi:hypothetical protein
VQQIDSCLRELHLHKASGPDDLAGEHLLYAHPNLIIHLKLLFSLIVVHGFVPDAFGRGILVPLVKDKSNNINKISNYRPITLTPVISKVSEAVLMRICEGSLAISDLQFVFKKGIECCDVIFSVRTVVIILPNMVVQSVQLLWISEKRSTVLITISCMIHFSKFVYHCLLLM